MIYPVILSGGSGSRLWPLSRAAFPKQFLPLATENSLLQATVQRLTGIPDLAPPLVVCNDEHRFMLAEQLRELGITPQAILLEPLACNTAPAVAVAALALTRQDPQALMLVLPADHLIADTPCFHEAIARARAAAELGQLCTFGIIGTRPETGYGYIHQGEPLPGVEGVWQVAGFVEKPDRATAEGYLENGGCFWNSGMFLFRAADVLDEFQRLHPDMIRACVSALEKAKTDLDFIRLDREAFASCESISFDYAVMEHTARAAVVPAAIGWSDIGAWDALWEVGERDARGNVLRGDVLAHDTTNCYVRSESRLVATLGVADLVVVETGDAVLVAHRDRVQDVKRIVEQLKAEARSEHIFHTRVYRPWGWYEGIDAGERFQVKRIMVKPGEKISLQMHHHRAEHWIVVSGTAKVTCDQAVTLVTENQSTYIPLGGKHRLENPGKLPLHLIEVQSGPYLGEDDIVRFEDIYQRT
jgi:mannose-1-phosphate guanylyltransferase/mannose-1-phosphate guanylyltransferase/mannose-6-phosphate isomerase